MGLDIRFNTIGSKAFDPLCEWEFDYYANIDLNMPRPMSSELKEIVTKAKELGPKIKAGDVSAEIEWSSFVRHMNIDNGHISSYFRKVPRLVPTTLYLIARAKGLSEDDAEVFAFAGNVMGVDKEGWKLVFGDLINMEELYSGKIELKVLEQVVTEFSKSNKRLGLTKKYHGTDGFFWGSDDDTCDREVWMELRKMVSLIKRINKEHPGVMEKNEKGKILVEYSFSW